MNIAHWTDPPESRVLLHDISWETFEALAEERSGSVPRLTYDEGLLELMSPLRQHENIGRLIGRFVESYTEVRDIEITVRRFDNVQTQGYEKGIRSG